ncbi:hypothetical protein J6U78_03580 [bacterium]|nr:hypothetical protein [bacterium]
MSKDDDQYISPGWLEGLSDKVSKAMGKEVTKKEFQKILTKAYLDSLEGKEIKDATKIIETIMKFAPTKEDLKESELGEPISILVYAESIIDDKVPPKVIKADTIFKEGDKKKIMAKVTEPFRMGDTVKYDKEEKYDAMKEAAKPPEPETTLDPGEEEKPYVEFNPAQMMEEKIAGEEMTAEKNLSWEEIRENIEKSNQKKKVYDPASTESVYSDCNLEDSLMAQRELEAQRRAAAARRERQIQKENIELRLKENEEILRQREEARANDYLGEDDPLERTI